MEYGNITSGWGNGVYYGIVHCYTKEYYHGANTSHKGFSSKVIHQPWGHEPPVQCSYEVLDSVLESDSHTKIRPPRITIITVVWLKRHAVSGLQFQIPSLAELNQAFKTWPCVLMGLWTERMMATVTASSFSLFSQGLWTSLQRFDRDNTHSQEQQWKVMIRAKEFHMMSNGDRSPARNFFSQTRSSPYPWSYHQLRKLLREKKKVDIGLGSGLKERIKEHCWNPSKGNRVNHSCFEKGWGRSCHTFEF